MAVKILNASFYYVSIGLEVDDACNGATAWCGLRSFC